jgi:protease-4
MIENTSNTTHADDLNANNSKNSGSQWERQTIQKVLLEHIREQRRARRWGIFFKLMFFVLAVFIFSWLYTGSQSKDIPQPLTGKAHTALINIRGEIMDEQDASAENIRDALKAVFENKHVKAVVLRINSPGGSPVQSRQIWDEIMRYKAKYPGIKIYAAIEEMGTSAAYLIATAADEIYADKTSLVGSIGVRLDSFGFVDAIHKIGVERRLYAAGKHKGLLDPFLPSNPEDDAFINEQLKIVHQAFIENVRQGRGARLKETPDIFSGLFWTGEQAIQLGLIDAFGDASYIAREIVKADLVDYTPSTGLLDRLANRIGASAAKAILYSTGHIGIK